MEPAAIQHFAIYDMDKTITRRPTWTPFLVRTAATHAPWRLALLPLAGLAVVGYALRLVDRARLKELTLALLIGRRIDADWLADAAARFAAHVARHGLYPDAVARIAADRAAGRRIVMATASCRFYAAPIAATLGITDVIATDLVRDGGGAYRAQIAGENCYGAAKLRMMEAWLRAQQRAREQVHARFYSDHVSDAPALEWADEAFAVNPHPPLRTLAQARGWTILDWAD